MSTVKNKEEREERIEKFIRVVKGAVGDFIIFVSHVDTDSIGGSVGLKAVIEKFAPEKAKVKIFYHGPVGLKQNQIVMNKYGLEQILRPIEEYEPQENDNYVLVDSSASDSRLKNALNGRQPLIIIDHHLQDGLTEDDNQFYWIEQIGSACTQIAELVVNENININLEDEDNRFIAMLLAVGIHTDTRSLVTDTYRDLEMYVKVKKAVERDNKDFSQLINFDWPESYFTNLSHAIDNKKVNNDGILVTGIGVVPPKEGDDIAPISNALIRTKNVDTAYVWCIIGDSTVRISARSTDLSKTVDDLLKEHFQGESVGAKLTSIEEFEGGGTIRFDLGSFGEIMSLVSADKSVRKAKEDLVKSVFIALLLGGDSSQSTEIKTDD